MVKGDNWKPEMMRKDNDRSVWRCPKESAHLGDTDPGLRGHISTDDRKQSLRPVKWVRS